MIQNRFGIIFSVANKRPIAWTTAQALHKAGARLAFIYLSFQEPQRMGSWSRAEVITLISLLFVIVGSVAALFVVPEFRRLARLERSLIEKDILIFTPNNKGEMIRSSGESMPLKRSVAGKVIGYTEDDIERLGLQVEVLIKTDKWYAQGSAPVFSNGKWKLEASFGGVSHIIRAILKDRDNRELVSTDIEVKVV